MSSSGALFGYLAYRNHFIWFKCVRACACRDLTSNSDILRNMVRASTNKKLDFTAAFYSSLPFTFLFLLVIKLANNSTDRGIKSVKHFEAANDLISQSELSGETIKHIKHITH